MVADTTGSINPAVFADRLVSLLKTEIVVLLDG